MFLETKGNVIRAGFPTEQGVKGHVVTAKEAHPREDVAVLTLADPPESSRNATVLPATVSATASYLYQLWGYPDSAAYELVDNDLASELRPDLIYSEGHIRRRMTNVPVPNVKGSCFIELSAVAGGGCSGSPVMDRRTGYRRGLLGVYLGERLDNTATSVGYAVRIEDISDWVPQLVGRSLAEELADNR